MMHKLRESKIADNLKDLSKDRQVLFGLHMIKRLWPNYVYFFRQEGFGDLYLFDEVLAQVKNYFDKKVNTSKVKALNEKILNNTPDSEEYDSIYSTFALDAGGGMDALLNLLSTDDKEEVLRITDLSISTVYIFVLDGLNIPSVSSDYPYPSDKPHIL
jgi:uncharacterized protein YjaG (DUF416 family)